MVAQIANAAAHQIGVDLHGARDVLDAANAVDLRANLCEVGYIYIGTRVGECVGWGVGYSEIGRSYFTDKNWKNELIFIHFFFLY